MKIKTKLLVNSALPMALVAITGIVLFWASRYVGEVTDQARAANAIVKDVFELTVVADEYMLAHGERAHKQWNLKYESLGKRLHTIEPREVSEKAILTRIRAEHQGIKATFFELADNYRRQSFNLTQQAQLDQALADIEAAKRQAGKKAGALSEIGTQLSTQRERMVREARALRELDARLAGQLLSKSQAMVSGGLQLASIHQAKVTVAEWRTALAILGFVLFAGFGLASTSLVITRSVLRPIARVRHGTEIIARGDLTHRLNIRANDEIGDLARTFDHMMGNLMTTTASRDELNRANQELKNSTAALVQAEKLASIGQMVAGVAHEINTPLAYVHSSVEMVKDQMPEIERLIAAYGELTALLKSGADDQVLTRQFERVNQLATAFRTDHSMDESRDLLARSMHGLDQIRELVLSLKNFSRTDRQRVPEFNVNDGLDNVLMLARPVLKARVKVVKEYGPIPFVSCSPSQINQVFLNVITNAAQAIEAEVGGTIVIQTRAAGDRVLVVIRDNGKGIPAEVLPKIFEPFFTTKKVGEGTGLGLSISRKIVEEHGGTIKVESVVGKGSNVTVSLPAGQEVKQQKRA